jgi:hypothetical protein
MLLSTPRIENEFRPARTLLHAACCVQSKPLYICAAAGLAGSTSLAFLVRGGRTEGVSKQNRAAAMLFGVREVLNHNKFVVKHNQSVKAEMKAFCVEIRFKFLVDCDVVRSSNRPWVMMRLRLITGRTW